MEADLEERIKKYKTGCTAEYVLKIKTGTTKEIQIGSYLKDYTKNSVPEYRKALYEMAEKLGIDCTQTLLHYFSSKQFTIETKDGMQCNIHPVGEKMMIKKILEELAKLDPSITGENTPQKLTRIGSRELKDIELIRFKKIYKAYCT